MLSGFLGSEEFSNLLWFAMLSADWTECGAAMCRSQPQSVAGNKALYINVKQSFENVDALQELQLRIGQSILCTKRSSVLHNLKYLMILSTAQLTILSASIATKAYSKFCI